MSPPEYGSRRPQRATKLSQTKTGYYKNRSTPRISHKGRSPKRLKNPSRSAERHHVIHLSPDTNPFAEFVIMMTRDVGHDLFAGFEL